MQTMHCLTSCCRGRGRQWEHKSSPPAPTRTPPTHVHHPPLFQISPLEDSLVWSSLHDAEALLHPHTEAMLAEWEEEHGWGAVPDLEEVAGAQHAQRAGINSIRCGGGAQFGRAQLPQGCARFGREGKVGIRFRGLVGLLLPWRGVVWCEGERRAGCSQGTTNMSSGGSAAHNSAHNHLALPLHGTHACRRVELVLLHDPTQVPAGTAAWLAERPRLARHHHVRPAQPQDLARLSRWLAGALRTLCTLRRTPASSACAPVRTGAADHAIPCRIVPLPKGEHACSGSRGAVGAG